MYIREKGILIVAVDHGFCTIKTPHEVFDNGVKVLDTMPAFKENTIRAKEMIVEYIKKHGSTTKSTVQVLCGFSEQQARRTLEKMQKEDIIKLANAGRYAKYTLF